jgi:hypothetical protein
MDKNKGKMNIQEPEGDDLESSGNRIALNMPNQPNNNKPSTTNKESES